MSNIYPQNKLHVHTVTSSKDKKHIHIHTFGGIEFYSDIINYWKQGTGLVNIWKISKNNSCRVFERYGDGFISESS
jgi:hypothetical protein